MPRAGRHNHDLRQPARDRPGRVAAVYTSLGSSIDKRFSDDTSGCVVVSQEIDLMIMTRGKFAGFSPTLIGDPSTTASAILALSAEDRAGVDNLVEAALASGGSASMPTMEMLGRYGRSFQNPDGHLWEVLWMDTAALAVGAPPSLSG